MYYMTAKVLIIDQESLAKVCWHSYHFDFFSFFSRKRRTCDEGLISYTGRICWWKCRNFPSKCFHPVVLVSSRHSSRFVARARTHRSSWSSWFPPRGFTYAGRSSAPIHQKDHPPVFRHLRKVPPVSLPGKKEGGSSIVRGRFAFTED